MHPPKSKKHTLNCKNVKVTVTSSVKGVEPSQRIHGRTLQRGLFSLACKYRFLRHKKCCTHNEWTQHT